MAEIRKTRKMALELLTYICILLLPGWTEACDECLLYQRLSSDCPSPLSNPIPYPVTSESECVLHCTLRRECQVSAYLTESATCYSLDAGTSTAACSSGVVARRKGLGMKGSLPDIEVAATTRPKTSGTTKDGTATVATTSVSRAATSDNPASLSLALSFASNVLLWFNFRKGYDNLANPSVYAASPQNVFSQDAVNGVKLAGSSSFVSASTPGFYRNFLVGRKFSFFFQGYFAMGGEMCISSFNDGTTGSTASYFNTRNNGGIHSRTYFVDGSDLHVEVNTQPYVNPTDTVRRVHAVGVSFDGSAYVNKWYINGTLYDTQSSNKNGGSPVLTNNYDKLRIGDCLSQGPSQFDGSLHCWGFVNNSLGLSEFDSLRSLCNA